MSTVQEIKAVIPRLSRAELEEFRAWFEKYVGGHAEHSSEAKAGRDATVRAFKGRRVLTPAISQADLAEEMFNRQ